MKDKTVIMRLPTWPKITSVDRLIELSNQRRAVWFDHWDGPKSAAFMISMPLRTVLTFMQSGLYEYPKSKQKLKG